MLQADTLRENLCCIDDRWVAVKPIKAPLFLRIKDAFKVLKGEAEAVQFYKQ